MINASYLHSETTSKVLSIAFEVHNIIGAGFAESIYHNAIVVEADKRGVEFKSEVFIPIIYKDHKVGARRADFVFENKVIVEIKATSKLEDIHLAQAINYLEVFNFDVGLLLNFGSKSLEYKRLIHPSLLKKNN